MPSNRKHKQLGLIVLPIPESMRDNMITWDEYKALTGIDLNDLFVVGINENDVYNVLPRANYGKLLAFDMSWFTHEDIPLGAYVLPIALPVIKDCSVVVDEDISVAEFNITLVDKDGSGIVISVFANKKIAGATM